MNTQVISVGFPLSWMRPRISALPVVLALLVSAAAITPVLVKNAAPALTSQPSVNDAASMLQFTSGGHALGFSAHGMYAATGTHALHVDFMGANAIEPRSGAAAGAEGRAAPLPRVNYANLWDGISLTYTPAAGGIYSTTYTLSPGADASDIRLGYNAPLTPNKDGTLRIAFETGSLTESAPRAWQDIRDRRIPVDVSFRVRGQKVTFALGRYDPRYALTIDPSVVWNTFLGGSGDEDLGYGIAVDGSGNVYVAGYSNDTWGTPVRPYTASFRDAFAAKLNSAGVLTWNTFLGGTGGDIAYSIAVDGSGNVYVSGESGGSWGSPVRPYTGIFGDAFAAKLTSAGVLTWNTFLGASGAEGAQSIAVDGSGNVYVAGYSDGTWGAPVRAYTAGPFDAFAARLTSAGALTWNTFLGGTGSDFGYGIAVDGIGNVYLAGNSYADWGTNPVRAYSSNSDVFAAKLTSAGAKTWHTFLGGNGYDDGQGIAVDGSGNVYVSGSSDVGWGSPVRAYSTGNDAFAAKLSSAGALTWNTFLGGVAYDNGNDIAVDVSGNVYVAGYSTDSWGSPVRADSGAGDAFAAKLSSSGALTWNTFLGGIGADVGRGIAVDGNGAAYVTGDSTVTWGSPVRAFDTAADAFAAKLGVMFKSVGTYDGWILESAETSGMGGLTDSIATTVRVGDDAADKQYRSIVSFNTASLPDTAVITGVTLRIRRQGITGTNPFTTHGTLMAAIRKPYFGAAVTLANADFQAALSKQVGFSSVPVSNWYSTNYNSAIWPYINLTGTTQFRLRFTLDDNDDLGADYVSFYSGNGGAASRPQLIVEFYVP